MVEIPSFHDDNQLQFSQHMARQNIVILIKQAILKWKLSEPIKFTLCKQSEIAICPKPAFLIGNSVKVSVSKDTQELKLIATTDVKGAYSFKLRH